MKKKLKVAIVCDWLTNQGGAENVVWNMHEIFPDAPIFTSVYNQKKLPQFKNANIQTSFLQKMPYAKKKHQWYLSLMPIAFEQFDLSEFDIVISSSHSCAKGIITKPETLHICYCHTPMRYAWDESHSYIKNYNFSSLIKKWYIPKVIKGIRIWDRLAADRVDYFLANSKYISRRIKKYYEKDSYVIYPSVEGEKFEIGKNVDNYFLAVGRLIPYKRFDLIVNAFNELGLPLKIVGNGPELDNLKKIAKDNIEFLGFVENKELKALYQNCQAFIFPQMEDFGIVPLEAMASGRPVIAYKKGGALETVVEEKTGIFFEEQNVESLKKAIKKFQKTKFDSKKIREHALKFDTKVFQEKLLSFVEEKYDEWQEILKNI